MIDLHLPLIPPSANDLWRIAGRRLVRTDEYNAWLDDMGYFVNRHCANAVAVPYRLSIAALRPSSRRDLDNIIKPTSDLLQKMGAVKNDSLCEMVVARWVTQGEGVHVRVEPAGVE